MQNDQTKYWLITKKQPPQTHKSPRRLKFYLLNLLCNLVAELLDEVHACNAGLAVPPLFQQGINCLCSTFSVCTVLIHTYVVKLDRLCNKQQLLERKHTVCFVALLVACLVKHFRTYLALVLWSQEACNVVVSMLDLSASFSAPVLVIRIKITRVALTGADCYVTSAAIQRA